MADVGGLPAWAPSALISIGIAAGGGLISWGASRQSVRDLSKAREEDRDQHRRDLDNLEKRVAKAEDAAADVKGIPAAIEHMGQRLAEQIGHVAEMFGVRHEHLEAEIEDIRARVDKKPRAARSRKMQA